MIGHCPTQGHLLSHSSRDRSQNLYFPEYTAGPGSPGTHLGNPLPHHPLCTTLCATHLDPCSCLDILVSGKAPLPPLDRWRGWQVVVEGAHLGWGGCLSSRPHPPCLLGLPGPSPVLQPRYGPASAGVAGFCPLFLPAGVEGKWGPSLEQRWEAPGSHLQGCGVEGLGSGPV